MPPMRPSHPYYQLDETKNNQIPGYQTSNRDIQLMDYSTDKFGKLSLKDALNNLQCFKPKDGNGDEFVEGCDFADPHSFVTTRNYVESPFETQTTEGVRKIKFFGEMEERFLSKEAFALMLQQLEKKGVAAALASNSIAVFPQDANVGVFESLATGGLGKRGREEISTAPVVYATLTTGSLSTEPTSKQMARTLGLTEMETHNNEKLASRDPAAAKYLATLTKSLDMTTKTAIAQRTYGLLASGNEALIKDEVVLPLQESLSNTGGLAEERRLQKDTLIKRLAQASEMVTAGLQDQTVPTVTQQTKTGFFTLGEVANASKVEYLDPATGQVVAAQKPFNLDSPLGFVRQQLALSRDGDKTRTGELVDHTQFKQPTNKVLTSLWANLEAKIVASKEGQKFVNMFVKRLYDFYETNSVLVFLLLMQKVNKTFLHFLADNHIFFPYTVLIPRPWICVQTYCVIIGTGGRALGATYIQNPDVGKGSDETSKILEFHVTLWNKAVVHHPGLITVWDDRALRNYMGGGSLRFITKPEYATMKTNDWRIPQTDKRGSLFALLCGYDESKPLPDVINFRTKRLMKDSDPDKMNDAAPVVCVEDNQWFKDYINHTPLDNHPMQTWVQQQTNALCFQATQLLYNPYEGKFSCVIYSNNNHFGPNMYAGMMRDLMDGNLILKDQGYNNPSQYTQWYSM